MYAFMIGSPVASVCTKVSKKLQFNVKTDFDQTNCRLKTHNFLCLKGRTEFLWKIFMQAHHE